MSDDDDSFFNTINLRGRELREAELGAKTQERRVLIFFRNTPPHEFTPEDIGARVLQGTPRTSWGRAITNLTSMGFLEKTTRQARGAWGKPIYYWRLKPETVERQQDLFASL